MHCFFFFSVVLLRRFKTSCFDFATNVRLFFKKVCHDLSQCCWNLLFLFFNVVEKSCCPLLTKLSFVTSILWFAIHFLFAFVRCFWVKTTWTTWTTFICHKWTYGKMNSSFFTLYSSLFILHAPSLLPPMLLRYFSYWYIHVEEFHLRAYWESYKSQKGVRWEAEGRHLGGWSHYRKFLLR